MTREKQEKKNIEPFMTTFYVNHNSRQRYLPKREVQLLFMSVYKAMFVGLKAFFFETIQPINPYSTRLSELRD